MNNNADWITDEHSVNSLAAALGVDRVTLGRALAKMGLKKARLSQAHAAMAQKSEDALNRSRKMAADAEAAEISTAKEKGTLMLTANAVRWAKEIMTHARAVIMSFRISEGEKRRGCAELTKIQLSE